MKERKLKSFVIPSIYIVTMAIVFISVVFLGNYLIEVPTTVDRQYAVDSIDTEVIPVIKEEELVLVEKPFTSETVIEKINYYNKEDEIEVQQNSLVYYQKTYMQNTGILYSSDEEFEILATNDGVIKDIKTDDVMGIVVEIEHEENITTFYYSLSEVIIKIGDEVIKGDKVGVSGTNKLENSGSTNLLFEVYYKGKTMDPNDYYSLDLNNIE